MQPKFYIDKNLRFTPKDPQALKKHISMLKQEMESSSDQSQIVSLLGEISVYLDRLNLFDKAEELLLEALALVEKYNLGIRKTVQQKIRLATVIQHKKDFKKSTLMFSEIIQICSDNLEAELYLDYALQHFGKNYFDQNHYEKALIEFEKAYEIRKKKNAQADQIKSTEFAIKETNKRINLKIR